jgi:hypothetical protein
VAILAVDEVWLREPRLLVPGRQPLGPVKVNANHSLSRSLVAQWLFHGNQNSRDVVSGKKLIVQGSPVWTPGVGFSSPGAQWNLYTTLPELATTLSTVTVSVLASTPSFAARATLFTWTDFIRTWGNTSGLQQHFATTGKAFFYIQNAYPESQGTPFTYDTKQRRYTVVYNNTNPPKMFVDGVQFLFNAQGTTTTWTNVYFSLSFNPSNGDQAYWNGSIGDCVVFNRALSDNEVIEHARNPYQFLASS